MQSFRSLHLLSVCCVIISSQRLGVGYSLHVSLMQHVLEAVGQQTAARGTGGASLQQDPAWTPQQWAEAFQFLVRAVES